MKKNRKIMGGFVACLHCLLMCIPLLVLVYNVGRRAIEKNFSYETTYVYDNNGNYQESSKIYELADLIYYGLGDTMDDFNYGSSSDHNISSEYISWNDFYNDWYIPFPFLMDNNYLGVFDSGNSFTSQNAFIYAYLNFYLNWIINMSVIVFIPEILIIFIDICRKLIYSFSHKIDGGF